MQSAGAWGVIGIGLLCLMIPHLILWLTGAISARSFAGVAVAVVAAIHIYFGLLEGTQWNRPAGLQIHRLGQEVADQTRQVGRNMGLYNAILALVLIGTLFLGRLDTFRAQAALLSLIIVAGLFGTMTIGSPMIVLVQSLPASLALAAVLLGRPGTLSEDQAIDRIIANEEKLLGIKTAARGAPTMLRGQHPKSVGFVIADFVVNQDVPEDLTFGVFRRPGFRYGAVVRFSNARVMNDSERGGQRHGDQAFRRRRRETDAGGVRKEHPGFPPLRQPIFFIRDAFDYLDFEAAELWSTDKQGETSKMWLALSFPRPRSLIILSTQLQAKPPTNPLGATYWSVVPYRIGPRAVKFRVRSEHQPVGAITGGSENSINEALKSSVNHPSEGGWRFIFEAQRQTDPDLMPIEDPTIDWGQDDQKFVKLATIEIRPEASLDRFGDSLGLNWPPSSTADENDATKKRSEHLSFSPWHGLVEHEPLGGINRVRRRVYEALSKLRHHKNGESRVEPEEIKHTLK